MKRLIIFLAIFAAIVAVTVSAQAAAPSYPDYMKKAQTLLDKAAFKASELDSFADEVLIARNFMRNAEAEYTNNLGGWSGKLDPKAEPTVRYMAAMAGLQASIVISRAEKIAQDKERSRLEAQLIETRNKIKVFDDKNAEIADLRKQLAASKSDALSADVSAKSLLSIETGKLKQALDLSEKKASVLAADLEDSRSEVARLKAELERKGAAETQSKEQIEALNRQKEFAAEMGRLGGVIKAGSDNMTVIFSRSLMIKAPKFDSLTAEGDKAMGRVSDLMKKYPEFMVKLKVHGFGTPAKNEDASATDRMARMIREKLLAKGGFEPAVVEALGAGAAEPIYPKTNPEGNRRVEITFVRK